MSTTQSPISLTQDEYNVAVTWVRERGNHMQVGEAARVTLSERLVVNFTRRVDGTFVMVEALPMTPAVKEVDYLGITRELSAP